MVGDTEGTTRCADLVIEEDDELEGNEGIIIFLRFSSTDYCFGSPAFAPVVIDDDDDGM